jgi:hypothetical protein
MFLGLEHACFEMQQQYFDKNCRFIFLSKYLFIKISLFKIAHLTGALRTMSPKTQEKEGV